MHISFAKRHLCGFVQIRMGELFQEAWLLGCIKSILCVAQVDVWALGIVLLELFMVSVQEGVTSVWMGIFSVCVF